MVSTVFLVEYLTDQSDAEFCIELLGEGWVHYLLGTLEYSDIDS